jgi:hypothetical protein
MIVLNTSWNKDYLQKNNEKGRPRCWVMILKSSTKKGSKMFWKMHSQERIVTPMFPPACKYNYNLPKDYGKTEYVWMLELMNLFVIKGNVCISVIK